MKTGNKRNQETSKHLNKSPCLHPAGEQGTKLYSSCHPTGVSRPRQQLKAENAPWELRALHGDPGKYHSKLSSV